LSEPDYSQPVLDISKKIKYELFEMLFELYGSDQASTAMVEIERLMKVHFSHKPPEMIKKDEKFNPAERFSEKDCILITYGDLIKSEESAPLETLTKFCNTNLKGIINTIHILPFFPYSSDRGFSVMDFEEVNPMLGNWEDIMRLKKDFNLMFDGVFNHASAKSRWFQEFLNMNPRYTSFFIVFSTKEKISEDHLKLIVRPRTSNLLTEFDTLDGKKNVWTTFSSDQIDLNFKCPRVFLKILDILLFYIRKGSDLIRLDAVTYIWSTLGTSCAHLKEAHLVIKLFRKILDQIAPTVGLITETNVPHQDNIQYFGSGDDEAQMVYNFALPPLVLHTFLEEDSTKLTNWAANLQNPSKHATFFNFLDSHDGIGVMAVKNILSKDEINSLALNVLQRGGFISYKDNGDGTSSPYELNITWYSVINDADRDEPVETRVQRFIASRSIALIIIGVPGIYLHSFLGSKNDSDSVLEERNRRSINRRIIRQNELDKCLSNKSSSTSMVITRYSEIISKRILEPAFHPNTKQIVFEISKEFFVLLRKPDQESNSILTITNISNSAQEFKLDISKLELSSNFINWIDVLSDQKESLKDGMLNIFFKPYDFKWLKPLVE
jgi:sucrose phosphorylase